MSKILDRKDVPVEETWDLSDLIASDDEYDRVMKDIQDKTKAFVEAYEGKLNKADVIVQALKNYEEIMIQANRIGTFTGIAVEADTTDTKLAERDQSCATKLAEVYAQLAFLDVELASQEETVLKEAGEKEENYRRYLNKLIEKKPHLLSQETEAALAALHPVFDAPYRIYNDIKFGDIRFPNFEAKGKEMEMTYNSFENHLEAEEDPEIRRKAFEVFSKELQKYEEGTASTYNSQVQQEKIESKLRHYDSVFDYLLSFQDVTREMYDRQIDLITKELAPAMQRYAKLIQHIHGIEEMTTADLKLEIDPGYAPEMSFEKAADYIKEGLSVLGEEYGEMLNHAFADRWIDYAENRGKRTGAFCSSPYSTHSYVLCSFNHKMDEVMTLAHELGHAGHFHHANKFQNFLNADCSMYFVESPSTTNEIIMENYLLKKAGGNLRMRRWVLSQMISKTYYHNFVTHLLEAAYQREVYKIVDRGGSVYADTLNGIYKDVLTDFWGKDVKVLDGSTRTWMRQPHYYMGLYSYTYSAGLTIGTQMARRIISEGDHVAKEWLEVLKTGGSKTPVELAKMVGVDITTDRPLRDTIQYISDIIDEMIEITKKLEAEK